MSIFNIGFEETTLIVELIEHFDGRSGGFLPSFDEHGHTGLFSAQFVLGELEPDWLLKGQG